jgi:hypothetical protein
VVSGVLVVARGCVRRISRSPQPRPPRRCHPRDRFRRSVTSRRASGRRCMRAVVIAGGWRRLALCSAGRRHRDFRNQRKALVRAAPMCACLSRRTSTRLGPRRKQARPPTACDRCICVGNPSRLCASVLARTRCRSAARAGPPLAGTRYPTPGSPVAPRR